MAITLFKKSSENAYAKVSMFSYSPFLVIETVPLYLLAHWGNSLLLVLRKLSLFLYCY
jgi:hypothetical protein